MLKTILGIGIGLVAIGAFLGCSLLVAMKNAQNSMEHDF